MDTLNNLSIKNICERIFALEAKHGLLDLQVDGVKIWQYKRMHIYHRIIASCGVVDYPPPLQRNWLSVLRSLWNSMVSILLHSPFRYRGKIDYLIFDHARPKILDGIPVDIYTHFLIEQLKKQGQRILVIEGPYQGTHIRPASPERRRLEAINFRSLFDGLLGRNLCSREGLRQAEALNVLVRETFAVNLDLRPIFRAAVPRFHSNVRSYSKLLARLQPKSIYLVNGYSHFAPLMYAARQAGISTVEIQHGVISRYHLGYSYPGRLALDYFADYLELWGGYWAEIEEIPLPRERIITRGFPYFHYMKKSHAAVRRRQNQVLIFSQTIIGSRLAEQVLQAIEPGSTEELKIVYKLHPSEYLIWRNYPALVRLAQMPNVEIIDRDCDVYRLYAESEYQLGVFSTAIFEGIAMGCKTILFNLPGVEYMEQLAERGLIVYFTEGSSLSQNLKAADSLPLLQRCEEFFGCAEAL